MRMKTASTCFLAAATLGGVSCQRVLQDVVPVVGLDFTSSSIVSASGDDSATAVADEVDLVKEVEYDDTISVVSPIEVGELLCDTLAQAEDAAALSFVILGNEEITAEKTFYAASNGNAFSNGIGRKVWMGTVTDPAQGEDEAVPRTVSMVWGDVCNTETFLLKVTKQRTDGTTSIVKTFPCHGSTTQTCMVEVEVELRDPTGGGVLPPTDGVVGNSTNGFVFDGFSEEEDISTDARPTIFSIPSDRRLQNIGDTVIDIVLLYTPEALSMVNTIPSQMETDLWASVARTNEAFVNSDIALNMNVVYLGQLPYTQGDLDVSDTLSVMREFDYITDLRDERGADLVQLVGGYVPLEACGTGYLYGSGSSYGFSVVDITCLETRSDSHEFGHNLGCDHNRDDATTSTAYAHGLRYCSFNDPYRTIMSYPCPFVDAPRVNYYSNPDVDYLNKPTGTSSEDCARAIEDNMVSVSNYRESLTESTPTSYTLVGCYGDAIRNRVLSGPSSKGDPAMTTEVCAAFCEGYRYFGTEFSSECFCGVEIDDPTELGAATCSYSCAGDASQTCGGKGAITVYENAEWEASPLEYLGCWTDTSGGRIMDVVETRSSMTNELCEQICSSYPFYGTQYGRECWCGSESTDHTTHGASDSCNVRCAGDPFQTCGGSYAVSVYEHEPVVAKGYLGCWADSILGRVMDEGWFSSTMTNDLCEEICAEFAFYATEYGIECWCANASTDYTIYGESTSCNMPCVGDTNTVCGGRFAMSVWAN